MAASALCHSGPQPQQEWDSLEWLWALHDMHKPMKPTDSIRLTLDIRRRTSIFHIEEYTAALMEHSLLGLTSQIPQI